MSIDEEFKYLNKVIDEIHLRMIDYAYQFENQCKNSINLKKKCVKHYFNEEKIQELLDNIKIFNSILKQEINQLLFEDEFKLWIDKRIKNERSIYDKLCRYQQREQSGSYPLNKCLNDLLGYRLVLQSNIKLHELYDILCIDISEKYNNKIKIINSSKDEYKAIHLYFKVDNLCFPCELQIWLSSDTEKNLASHQKYKQNYLNWKDYERNLRSK